MRTVSSNLQKNNKIIRNSQQLRAISSLHFSQERKKELEQEIQFSSQHGKRNVVSRAAYTDHNLTGTRGGKTMTGTQTNESTRSDRNLNSGEISIVNGGKAKDNIDYNMGGRKEDSNFDLKITSRNIHNSSGQFAQLRSREASKNYLVIKESLTGQNYKAELNRDIVTANVYDNPQTIKKNGWVVQNRPQTQGLKSTSLSKRSLRVTNKTFDGEKISQQSPSSNQLGKIKLALTKAEISRQKQIEKGFTTGYSRMKNTDSADGIHFSMGLKEKTPMTLELVRENHMNEYSITCKTKTNKAGVFEKERTLETSLDREGESAFISGEHSLLRHQLQRNQVQMPSIRQGLRSRPNLNQIQSPSMNILDAKMFKKMSSPYQGYGSKEFDLNGISQSSGSPIHQISQLQQASLLLHSSQQKMFDSQHALMQTELKELIKLEPYTHRAKQLAQTQLASTNSKNNSVSMDELSVLPHEQIKERRAPKMSNKEIYEWLNNTLEAQMQEEAEKFNMVVQSELQDYNTNVAIPQNNLNKTPLISLEIDRIALDKAGVEQQEVDRIYKGLYVSSVGFYGILKTALSRVQQSERYKVMGRLWKAFEILLENCQPTDFKMVVQKLREDHIQEINKVKDDFTRYKESFDIEKVNLTNELKEIKELYEEALQERDNSTNKCMEVQNKYLSLQNKFEEEIRLRLDFEIKINKLHGLNVALRGSESTLKRKIDDIEATLLEYKERNRVQAEEIVMLRSYKFQSEMTKQIDDVKIEVVQQNAMQAKQKLISAVENLQQADRELSYKTHLNLQLQSVVDNRESRIRALQDIVKANKDKDEEVNKLYNTQNSLVMEQEKIIREHMRSLNQTDGELFSTKRHLNETLFNAFEMQNTKARVKDLEQYMDKLLEETTEQRNMIEDFTEKVAQQKKQIEGLLESEKTKIEKIKELTEVNGKLETNLAAMTHSRNQLQNSLDELEMTLSIRNKKIGDMETQIYQLKKKVDEFEKRDEEQLAEISRERLQSEQQKKSSYLWETKFHKQVIASQKFEYQFKEFQDQTAQKIAEFEEREKELQFVMEGKKMMINSLQTVLNKVKEEKDQSQLVVMKNAIRKEILIRLIKAFLSHFLTQKGVLLQEISDLKEREAENQNLFEQKSMEMEDWMGQTQNLHQLKTTLEANLKIWAGACELQSSKAVNLSAKIVMLEKELGIKQKLLEKSEKQAYDRKALIDKIKASHKSEVEKMEKILKSQEEVFSDKISLQAKQIKDLISSEAEAIRSARNSEMNLMKSRQWSTSEIGTIKSHSDSIIKLELLKIDAETQTEPPIFQHVMIQTSQEISVDRQILRRQTESSLASSEKKKGQHQHKFQENGLDAGETLDQRVRHEQISNDLQEDQGIELRSAKNNAEPNKNTIEHKSPIVSKKMSIISGSKHKTSSRQKNSSKRQDSSPSSVKQRDLVNLSIKKKSSSDHGETSKEVDYSQMVSSPIYEIQSSNDDFTKSVIYRNKTSQVPRQRTKSMLKTPTGSDELLKAKEDSSQQSLSEPDMSDKHSRIKVFEQISQPRSGENSQNVPSNKRPSMKVGGRDKPQDNSIEKAQVQSNANTGIAAASLSNSKEESSLRNYQIGAKQNLKLKNQRPRATNIKGLLKSAINRP